MNILDTMYLSFIVIFIIMDNLLRSYEDYLPALSRCLKYGNFAYRGKGAEFLSVIEIPKAWYKHFYMYAVSLGVAILVHAVAVYFFNFAVNKYWLVILHFLCRTDDPSVSVAAALLTLLLAIVQTSRRYYETCYVQVFSKSSKMNIAHYTLAHIHYTGLMLATVSEAPLFCGDQNRDKIIWIDFRTTALTLPCLAIYFLAWREQYRSNIILSNLRRDKKSGEVVTEEYKIPAGGLFDYVSSPHRFCEVVIYFVYFLVTPTTTYFVIFLWVFVNQVLAAHYTHIWYTNTFKDFSKDKRAIIPAIM